MRPYRIGFRAKVLLPTCLILALLAVFLVWRIGAHFEEQLEAEARRSVRAALAAFDVLAEARGSELRGLYLGLAGGEPLGRALGAGDGKALERLLAGLSRQCGATMALYTPADGGDATLVGAPVEATELWGRIREGCAPAVSRALEGECNVALVEARGRLWEATSTPVGNRAGVLTFAREAGTALALRIRELTSNEVALLAGGGIVACTLDGWERLPQLRTVIEKTAAEGSRAGTVEIGGERHEAFAGTVRYRGLAPRLDCVLLRSTAGTAASLHRIQKGILAAAAIGILLSSLILWFVLQRASSPLFQLRAGAEAVGNGDFSRRVLVNSGDEIGDLAVAFNRMTESLCASRLELERTVERLRTTQAQLVQTEKLAAVAEFVAGVSHELNNPLTAVIGFAELLQGSELDPRCREDLDQIVIGARRCRRIVQSLLSFASGGRPERRLSNVNELVENTLCFVQHDFQTSGIRIIRRLDPALPALMVDPHQLQQAFLNILSHTRQAVGSFRPDGEMTVTTELRGDRVRVAFADNGPGIAREEMGRLFDPVVSTVEAGRGTGLGLRLCYGIIQEHGGCVVVDSEPGRGAVYTVELPLGVRGDLA